MTVHPHRAAREAFGPFRTVYAYGKGRNAKLALGITNLVGTMACAYAFTALALISLPSSIKSGSLIILVSWVAQTFLQLVLLSIIMVGQNVAAKASDKRAADTFKDVELILHETTEHFARLHTRLDALESRLGKPAEPAN